jgi:hypothetical protein
MLSTKLWGALQANQDLVRSLPAKLKELAKMPFRDVRRLPSYDEALTHDLIQPHVEPTRITTSYLDFLKEQIRLEPRGEEWSRLLQNRLKALEPFQNQDLHIMMLRSGTQSCTIYMDDFRVFHWEIFC